MSGGGGGGDQTVGFRYYFGVHMGLCRGADEIVEARVGGRTAWTGSVTSNTTINIDKYDLFGGEDGEGGVQGPAEIMMGGPTQTASSGLAAMLGGVVPGFRNAVTVFYNGIVSMLSPYPKKWEWRVRRTHSDWDGPVFAPGYAKILLSSGENLTSPFGTAYKTNWESHIKWGGVNVAGYGSTFTVEARFVFTTFSTNAPVLSLLGSYADAYGDGWRLTLFKDAQRFAFFWDSVNYIELWMDSPLQTDRAHNIALVLGFGGSSTDVKVYVDGVLRATGTAGAVTWTHGTSDPAYGLSVGVTFVDDPFGNDAPIGYVDEIRVTQGARYSTNYPNPTEPFATGASDPLWSNVLLLSRGGTAGTSSVNDVSSYGRTAVVHAVTNEYPQAAGASDATNDFAATDRDIHAMNAAHIIYECLTNRPWGRGLPREVLDEASFLAAAQTLYSEGFGLCIRWSRTDTIDSFIQAILTMVMGALYQDRTTGLIKLLLLRGDYDVASLPLFDVESGLLSIEEAAVENVASAINEVVVSYRDVVTNTAKKVRAQNIAALQLSGGAVNSKSYDYPGIPTASLALRVAQRELRLSSISLRRFSITLDRRGWDLYPGQVIRIRDLSRNIPEMVVRIGTFEEGSLTAGTVKLRVMQDVFKMPVVGLSGSQAPSWTPPNSTPCVGRSDVAEMPYFLLAKLLKPADFNALTPEAAGFMTMLEPGNQLNNSYDIAVKQGASDSSENPPDESYYCGYTP